MDNPNIDFKPTGQLEKVSDNTLRYHGKGVEYFVKGDIRYTGVKKY